MRGTKWKNRKRKEVNLCIEGHRASERENKGLKREDYLIDLGSTKWKRRKRTEGIVYFTV